MQPTVDASSEESRPFSLLNLCFMVIRYFLRLISDTDFKVYRSCALLSGFVKLTRVWCHHLDVVKCFHSDVVESSLLLFGYLCSGTVM